MDRPTLAGRGTTVFVRQFEVVVTDDADRSARSILQSDEISIGTSEGNDLRLTDPAPPLQAIAELRARRAARGRGVR